MLGKNGRMAEAEDAVLRNLDVDLERVQSTAALLSLYARQGKIAQLRARLANPAIVRTLPMPLVIRAAAVLGPRRTPEAVVARMGLIRGGPLRAQLRAGRLRAGDDPLWGLQASEMSLVVRDESYRQSTIALTPGQSEVRFPRIGEVGHPLYATSSPPSALLIVKFPDTPLVRLRLDSRPETGLAAQARASFPMVDLLTSASAKSRQQKLSLVSIRIGETEFPVEARLTGETTIPSDAEVDPTAAPADVDSPSPAGPAASPASTASPVTGPSQTSASASHFVHSGPARSHWRAAGSPAHAPQAAGEPAGRRSKTLSVGVTLSKHAANWPECKVGQGREAHAGPPFPSVEKVGRRPRSDLVPPYALQALPSRGTNGVQ